jgi:3-isopropylmalate/(R)-2-methylmalate dehydratase small subunit
MAQIIGRAWKFGESVDTDQIIPARFLHMPDPEELRRHCFADARPDFTGAVQPGDLVVGGNNFGCGSSREEAPAALKDNGVAAVIAKSFGRIFLRNAINIGLIAVECPDLADGARDGDRLRLDTQTGEIVNLTSGESYTSAPLPEFLQQIIDLGGLLNYVRQEMPEK